MGMAGWGGSGNDLCNRWLSLTSILAQVSPPGSPAGKQQQSPLVGRHPPPEQQQQQSPLVGRHPPPEQLQQQSPLVGRHPPPVSLLGPDVDAKDAYARLRSPRADWVQYIGSTVVSPRQYSDITLLPRQYGGSLQPSSGAHASSPHQGGSPATAARASERSQQRLGEGNEPIGLDDATAVVQAVDGGDIGAGGSENDGDRDLAAAQREVSPPEVSEAEGDDSAILSSEVAAKVSERKARTKPCIPCTLCFPPPAVV